MTKGSVCVCGPRPKGSVTGLSLAVELLLKGLDRTEVSTRVVDAAFGGNVQNSGSFSIRRAAETVWVILSVWWNLFFVDVYYTTLSTSTFGFIRDFSTGIVARLLGKRVVFHLHGGGFEDFYCAQRPIVQYLVRFLYQKVDTVVVLGELLKDQFYCLGDFVKPKLVVVPNGLTLGVDEPNITNKKLISEETVQLLYLSSLMPSKGFIDVLRAAVLLEQETPGRIHLHLCGNFVDAKTEDSADIYDEESLMGFIRTNKMEEAVTYHHQVSGADKDQRFRDAHVFLLPTDYPWEGQPLSIIEALAYATPVISCRHKGIPELVTDGRSGFFVDAGSCDGIAVAVKKLITDKERYLEMSIEARQHYEGNFRRGKHLKKLLAVILDCQESEIVDMKI